MFSILTSSMRRCCVALACRRGTSQIKNARGSLRRERRPSCVSVNPATRLPSTNFLRQLGCQKLVLGPWLCLSRSRGPGPLRDVLFSRRVCLSLRYPSCQWAKPEKYTLKKPFRQDRPEFFSEISYSFYPLVNKDDRAYFKTSDAADER